MFLNELTWVANSVCSRAHRFKELKREINNILEVKKKKTPISANDRTIRTKNILKIEKSKNAEDLNNTFFFTLV